MILKTGDVIAHSINARDQSIDFHEDIMYDYIANLRKERKPMINREVIAD